MSRIINKLVEASGGWETFLYKTLKDVCDCSPCGAVEVVDDAREILEAYEQLAGPGGRPNEASVTKTPETDDQSIEEAGKPVRKTPVIKTQKSESVVEPDDVEWKLEDLVTTLPPRPAPNPRRETCRIFVDKDLGGSSGGLPMSSGHKLVNRQALTVTTQEGMALGTASAKQGEEGQIKSQYVTGHVSVEGKYRLVFTDTNLGAALIHYEVVALPSKMPSKQYKIALAAANKVSVDDLSERLEHFGFVIEKCLCGRVECFGWCVRDEAEEVETEAQRGERIRATEAMTRNVSIQEGT